jgi:hypothetical protein
VKGGPGSVDISAQFSSVAESASKTRIAAIFQIATVSSSGQIHSSLHSIYLFPFTCCLTFAAHSSFARADVGWSLVHLSACLLMCLRTAARGLAESFSCRMKRRQRSIKARQRTHKGPRGAPLLSYVILLG